MPMTADERNAARALGRVLDRGKPENMARRRRYEAKPEAWLRYYLSATFPLPFGDVHKAMIAAAVRAIRDGHGMTVAAPRGTGKSSVLWGVTLWAVLSGAARFPVCAAWAHGAARRMLRRWLSTLADNERLAADYPTETAPFRETTHPVRLRLLRWKDTGDPAGADARIMDGLVQLPDGKGAIGAASVGASTRGLTASMPDGETLRPDVLFLDDPQSKAVAESAGEVRKTIEKIESDLFNLAGPETRLSVMVAATVIQSGDVTEHFLSHPDFEPVRVGQIVTWPEGFEDRASPVRRLWEQWNAERVEGMQEHDGGKRARAFYRKHKKALTAGMAVSWAHRYDKRRGDPDACFAALWDFYRLGAAAFMAERQNEPMSETTVYELTPELVASRVHPGRRPYELPPEAKQIVAATDLNLYGLHSAALGFGNDQTGWLAWYACYDHGGRGIVPANVPESEGKRMLYEALVEHGRHVAGLPLVQDGHAARVALWIIDAGFWPDVVRRYVDGPGRALGMQVLPARGFNADKYRPGGKGTIGRPREQCHFTESAVAGRFVAFNACYWREVSQRAWLASPNAPGSLSLPDEGRHVDFAEQVTRERLLEKLAGAYGPVWRWRTAPGRHDYGDAVTMAYVGAAWGGIGTAGGDAKPATKPARVLVYRPSQHGKGRRW